jgi:acyl-coenzyme A thioesterase PaaI-like protein
MHAGVLFSLGEFLGGLITARYLDNPRKFQPVVRDLKIDFKAPAMTDITATAYFSADQALEMNAKLEETGRYDFQQKAVLTDTNGTVVAETLGSYALRNFMG